jgi:hypothetical protein
MAAPAKHESYWQKLEGIVDKELQATTGGVGAGIVSDGGVANTAKNAVGDATSTAQLFGDLTAKNLYVRLGEFAVGSMMIYVGLKGIAPGVANVVIMPVKAGKTAAKGALLA